MKATNVQAEGALTGNVIALEHINLAVPSQRIATIFYVLGLGLTRDPYMSVGHENMWVNVGYQQFHLPTRSQQKIPGCIGLVVPSLSELNVRLETVESHLGNTNFRFEYGPDKIDITCPWGNRFSCFEPASERPSMILGISFIQFDVPIGVSTEIGRFYSDILGAPVERLDGADGISVRIGHDQSLLFRETSREIPDYDGHHVAVYLREFKEVFLSLDKLGLVHELSNDHQYRFQDIPNLLTGKVAFQLEHEVRSLEHPMYQRDLVNRNPNQGFAGYIPGNDRII